MQIDLKLKRMIRGKYMYTYNPYMWLYTFFFKKKV